MIIFYCLNMLEIVPIIFSNYFETYCTHTEYITIFKVFYYFNISILIFLFYYILYYIITLQFILLIVNIMNN